MSVRILDGRPFFYQWDSGQKLLVEDADGVEVHYSNGSADCTPVVPIQENQDGTRTADVPNILLQTTAPIRAFLFRRDTDSAITIRQYTFQVFARPKPSAYIYTETEVLSYSSLAARIEYLEKNGASDETIGAAVEKYLAENPIDTGVDFETDKTEMVNAVLLEVNRSTVFDDVVWNILEAIGLARRAFADEHTIYTDETGAIYTI